MLLTPCFVFLKHVTITNVGFLRSKQPVHVLISLSMGNQRYQAIWWLSQIYRGYLKEIHGKEWWKGVKRPFGLF